MYFIYLNFLICKLFVKHIVLKLFVKYQQLFKIKQYNNNYMKCKRNADGDGFDYRMTLTGKSKLCDPLLVEPFTFS